MTGWFNIVGLLGIVASVAYGAAIFLNILLGLYGLNIFGINFGDTATSSASTFLLFLIILLALHGGEHLRRPLPGADEQHLGGLAPARRRGDHRPPDLRAGPPPERELRLRPSGSTSPASSAARPATSGSGSSSLPIGFLLTMYTQTGYDASAHTAEETQGAADRAPRRASGARSSSRRSSAGSCCCRSCSRPTNVSGDRRRRGVLDVASSPRRSTRGRRSW